MSQKDDLISRQAMLDMVNGWTYNFCDPEDEWAAMKEIRELPSAEPERKTGRWKMEPDHYGFFDEIPVCSECGCTTKMRETYKFCPNCGAKMDQEERK